MVRRFLANGLGGIVLADSAFGTVTEREGNKGKMNGRLAAWCAPCWLLVEWQEYAEHLAKYFFSNLPTTTSLKRLVATAKSRWRIEHSNRELKDELGLNHFEGRSWRGCHHHMVLVLLAYAFLQDLRRRVNKGALA